MNGIGTVTVPAENPMIKTLAMTIFMVVTTSLAVGLSVNYILGV